MTTATQQPADIRAEELTLGALLLKPNLLPSVRLGLSAEQFYIRPYGEVYTALLELADAGKPLDIVLLENRLRTVPAFRDDGSPTDLYTWLNGGIRLLQWMEQCIAPDNAAAYAHIVREKAVLRQVMQQSQEAYRLAEMGDMATLAAGNGHYNLSALIKTAQPAPPIELLDVGAFLTALGDPPPMLVQGVLPENALILLTGKPKHGKSFLALDIASAVAAGQDVFGCYAVNRPGRVIYFSMEDSKYTLANRLLSRGVRPGDNLPLAVCTQRLMIGTSEGMDVLRQLVMPYKPHMIIVDTAAQALGIKDWSNRSEVTDRMQPLMELSREVCTVLLVAHNRKAEGDNGDEIAGTNAFTGAVDGWLSAQNKTILPDGNMRIGYTMDGRDIRGEFVVEMDTKSLHFKALSKEEIAEDDKQAAEVRRKEIEAAKERDKQEAEQEVFLRVMRCMARHQGEATAAVIQQECKIPSGGSWNRLMNAMMRAGHIRETGKFQKAEGAGRPTPIYTLCADSKLIPSTGFSYRENHVDGINYPAPALVITDPEIPLDPDPEYDPNTDPFHEEEAQ